MIRTWDQRGQAFAVPMTRGGRFNAFPLESWAYFLAFTRCILHSGQRPGLSEVSSGCIGQ